MTFPDVTPEERAQIHADLTALGKAVSVVIKSDAMIIDLLNLYEWSADPSDFGGGFVQCLACKAFHLEDEKHKTHNANCAADQIIQIIRQAIWQRRLQGLVADIDSIPRLGDSR